MAKQPAKKEPRVLPPRHVQKFRIQAQKHSNRIKVSTTGNKITVLRKWRRARVNMARRIRATVHQLAVAAKLDEYVDYLPPPTPGRRSKLTTSGYRTRGRR